VYDDLSKQAVPTARYPCCCAVLQAVKPTRRRVLVSTAVIAQNVVLPGEREYVEAFNKGEVKGKPVR